MYSMAKPDTATWFGNDPAFEHGVEYLPFTDASLYLGVTPHTPVYTASST